MGAVWRAMWDKRSELNPQAAIGEDLRPSVGQRVRIIVENADEAIDYVRDGTAGMIGTIVEDDNSEQPFKIKLDDGRLGWYRQSWVELAQAGQDSSAILYLPKRNPKGITVLVDNGDGTWTVTDDPASEKKR